MDLSSAAIHDIIHPTAAFSLANQEEALSRAGRPGDGPPPPCWRDSQLNPKNRIDSLAPLPDPLWRIDGCTGLGTQFYLVPLFLADPPPMRIDAFIPEEAARHPLLRRLLGLDVVFHAKDAARVRRQGIAGHILRALQVWTTQTMGAGAVRDMYLSSPFGSRLVFETLAVDVRAMRISLAPTYYLERQMLSARRLAALWGLDRGGLPPAVDIADLSVVEQLQDSVCVVRCRGGAPGGARGPGPEGAWILKALTSSTGYLYHELRTLLALEPHPNVVARPAFLVTKQCRFGGKVAVVGFLEEYHAGGSLRDLLPLLRVNGRLAPRDQLRWAVQIAAGLLHVRERGRTYYPDLRLDNVVLASPSPASGPSGADAVIVDFEQRGVWCEFASPEVNALEYVRILASDGGDDGGDDGLGIPEHVRAQHARALDRHLPGWERLRGQGEYTSPPGGYNVPWLCLTPAEQEASEVYALGRVLWCLFEGVSAPERAAVWQSYPREPDLEFPAYRRAPPAARALIDACTRGRREALGASIVRRGSRLVFRDGRGGGEGEGEGEGAAPELRRFAREWWAREVAWAEEFLSVREDKMLRGEWPGDYFGRPTLREVLKDLEGLREKIDDT